MAKKKINVKGFVSMTLFWALYLTITMALFERYGVVPHNVPGGVIGWFAIVEIPRVILGWFISLPIFKYIK